VRRHGADHHKMLKRVLVVDDDPAYRQWAARLLAGEVDVVRTAATGADALAVARRLRPDVVVLDVQLPDLDGFTVCRQLREIGIQVVLCSVREARDYGARIVECGAAGFVAKERLSAAELRRALGDG
jgi:two-component system, chemotaxis family, chemotaxis protein CheY